LWAEFRAVSFLNFCAKRARAKVAIQMDKKAHGEAG
jgi:hypothetical protein